MKRWVAGAAAAMLLGAAGTVQADVHWHGRFYLGIGPGWYPYSYPYWYPPAYPYYYSPAPVIVTPPQPPVYIQRPAPKEQHYWYYCEDPKGYYPYVKECPKGWMKVVPPNPPQ